MRILIAALAGLALAACGELPQDGPKPFVTAKEMKTDGAALAARTGHQDEYPRTGAARR
jgi:hypothetical protein